MNHAADFGGPPSIPGLGIGLVVIAVLFVLLITAAAIFIGVVIVRNARRALAADLNPLTAKTDFAVKAMNSVMLAPSETTAEKLAELDALFAAGTISDAEHSTARLSLLGS